MTPMPATARTPSAQSANGCRPPRRWSEFFSCGAKKHANPFPLLEEGPGVHQAGEGVDPGQPALEGEDLLLPTDHLDGDEEENQPHDSRCARSGTVLVPALRHDLASEWHLREPVHRNSVFRGPPCRRRACRGRSVDAAIRSPPLASCTYLRRIVFSGRRLFPVGRPGVRQESPELPGCAPFARKQLAFDAGTDHASSRVNGRKEGVMEAGRNNSGSWGAGRSREAVCEMLPLPRNLRRPPAPGAWWRFRSVRGRAVGGGDGAVQRGIRDGRWRARGRERPRRG